MNGTEIGDGGRDRRKPSGAGRGARPTSGHATARTHAMPANVDLRCPPLHPRPLPSLFHRTAAADRHCCLLHPSPRQPLGANKARQSLHSFWPSTVFSSRTVYFVQSRCRRLPVASQHSTQPTPDHPTPREHDRPVSAVSSSPPQARPQRPI